MSSIRVLVIGCGIAGPVLSIFLKRKGYDPVLFDRLDGVQEAGISLMYIPFSSYYPLTLLIMKLRFEGSSPMVLRSYHLSLV